VGLKASAYTSSGSQFVKSEEVKAGPQSFTVDSVEAAETPDKKPALQLVFTGGKKLTLNKTNARVMAGLLGDDTDAWKGKKVVVSFDPTVMYAGKMIGGIRIRPQGAPAQPTVE
jgi:hypothetical protein